MKHALISCIVSTSLMLVVAHASAEDLGVRGEVYRVDKDGREQLKDVVRAKQRSGELDRFWEKYRDQVIDSVKNPKPLGVRSDYTQRVELRELRYVVPTSFRDHKGNVVVQKGTVVEPLKVSPLKTGLLFIDGRDPRQVEYAIRKGRVEPLKIVLTAGSPYFLRQKYRNAPWMGGSGIPFYFDQRKMIIDTLAQLYGINIGSVPTLLTQRGDRLAIESGLLGGSP